MRKCSICGEEKSDENFYTPVSRRCKSCLNKRQSEKVYAKNLKLYPDIEGEIWKWVVGFENLYRISNLARIRSEVYGGRRGKILNQRKGTNGYNIVLVKNGEKKCFSVSTLVAEAFLEKPCEYSHIIHIDGDTFNNCLSNLKYSDIEVNNDYLSIRNMPRVKHLYEEKQVSIKLPLVNSERWLSLLDIEGEKWKDIESFEGEYLVSNCGRVKSKSRVINGRFINEKILRCVNVLGYWKVNIHKKQYAVHRLVAISFIDNPNNLPFINHKDENTGNNFVFVNDDGTINIEKTNLEWCDCKYNLNYGNCKSKMRRARLVNPTMCKPTVCFCKKDFIIKVFNNQRDASNYTGVGYDSISRSCNHTNRFLTVKGYWFRKLSEVQEKLEFYNKYI